MPARDGTGPNGTYQNCDPKESQRTYLPRRELGRKSRGQGFGRGHGFGQNSMYNPRGLLRPRFVDDAVEQTDDRYLANLKQQRDVLVKDLDGIDKKIEDLSK
jgi:hypothetical protein